MIIDTTVSRLVLESVGVMDTDRDIGNNLAQEVQPWCLQFDVDK